MVNVESVVELSYELESLTGFECWLVLVSSMRLQCWHELESLTKLVGFLITT